MNKIIIGIMFFLSFSFINAEEIILNEKNKIIVSKYSIEKEKEINIEIDAISLDNNLKYGFLFFGLSDKKNNFIPILSWDDYYGWDKTVNAIFQPNYKYVDSVEKPLKDKNIKIIISKENNLIQFKLENIIGKYNINDDFYNIAFLMEDYNTKEKISNEKSFKIIIKEK